MSTTEQKLPPAREDDDHAEVEVKVEGGEYWKLSEEFTRDCVPVGGDANVDVGDRELEGEEKN